MDFCLDKISHGHQSPLQSLSSQRGFPTEGSCLNFAFLKGNLWQKLFARHRDRRHERTQSLFKGKCVETTLSCESRNNLPLCL